MLRFCHGGPGLANASRGEAQKRTAFRLTGPMRPTITTPANGSAIGRRFASAGRLMRVASEKVAGECPERQRGRTVNPLAMPS